MVPTRWTEESRTAHFVTFRRLEWSTDLRNELGVMYKTDDLVRVKLRSSPDFYYKKGIGTFVKQTGSDVTITEIREKKE